MKIFLKPLRKLAGAGRNRKEAQTLVEYALVLAVISIALIAAFSLLGSRIVVVFSAIANLLDSVQSSH
jgi:Flp pilus assembly pilin Flp